MWKTQFFRETVRTKAYCLCVCLVGILIAANGCASKAKVDTSLITDDPCAAPCWNNIVPGISTESTVRTRLENCPFVKAGTLNYVQTEQWGIRLNMFVWKARGKLYNRVYLRDGRVLRIEIALDYDLTLGDIVDKYGPPDTIYVARHPVHQSWYSIICDYFSVGLTIDGHMRVAPEDVNNGMVLLSRNAKITSVTYYSSSMSLQDVLGQVFLLPPDQIDRLTTTRQKWQGFGYIKFIK